MYNQSPSEHIFEKAYEYALEKHDSTGCQYAGYSYKLHIDGVVAVARQYLKLIESKYKTPVLVSSVSHDLLEDARVSYNDLKDWTGLYYEYLDKESQNLIVEIVYNCTNELGKNRKERSSRTYPKIARCKYSTFVKLCDRIANVKFSYAMNSGMFGKYCAEQLDFHAALYNQDHGFDEMWAELDNLVEIYRKKAGL